jgi:poly-gamma-glutamate synthesis protein (capsule biosynthesis protein)
MIIVSFFGDFCIKGAKSLCFAENLKSTLHDATLNVVNFEAPVKSSDARPIEKIGPCLDNNEEAPQVLEEAGYNVFTLANNHAMDFGGESLLHTISLLKNSMVVGAGTWNEAYRVKTVEVEGKRIGFLGLTHREFGVLTEQREGVVGTAWMMHPCVDKLIMDAKQNVDYLFVLPHAGVEHEAYPLPELVTLYRHYIDLGADGVFASHPHIPQGWETYQDKPIFYSLGNFCLDPVEKRERPFLKYGMMVTLRIEDSQIQTEIHYTKYDHEKKEVSLTNDSFIIEHLKKVNQVMKDEAAYMKEVNAYCERVLQGSSMAFARGGYYEYDTKSFVKQIIRKIIGKREQPNPNYIINLMQCESHRWAILRALRQQAAVQKQQSCVQ